MDKRPATKKRIEKAIQEIAQHPGIEWDRLATRLGVRAYDYRNSPGGRMSAIMRSLIKDLESLPEICVERSGCGMGRSIRFFFREDRRYENVS